MFYPDISNSTSEFMGTGTLALPVAARCGREVRRPGTGRASHGRGKPLTKIGFANTSIPFQFPTKEQGTLTIEGVDAPYAKAIPAIP